MFRKRLLSLLILMALVISAAFPAAAEASDTRSEEESIIVSKSDERDVPYRIMFISSYNYAYTTVSQQISGIVDGLHAIPFDINYEFMDTKAFHSSGDIDAFYKHLKYKIDRLDPYDLIILSDDSALSFALKYRSSLFNGIPMVFLGINNITDAKAAVSLGNITGIAEVLDFGLNYKLMKKLFPERDKIIVVIDDSNTAQGEYLEFLKFAKKTPEMNYSVINTSDYSRKGLEEAFSEIDDKSQILYLEFLQDGDGNAYTLESGTRFLKNQAPNVPIFRPTIADIENGVLGGVSYSYYEAGKIAGRMAVRVLRGTDINNIRLNGKSVNSIYFEQGEMDRFGITESDLPEGSIILNQHQTFLLFYRQNRLLMNLIFMIIFLMIIIITILTVANRRRRMLINLDYLTQMPNRQYISAKIKSIMDAKSRFGIIMIDVDHFKTINDTLGHLIGDELLIEVAKRLKSFSSRDVTFARIGGDEFMGLLHNNSREKADAVCRKLVEKMAEDFDLSCGKINITVSIGAAVYPGDTDNPNLVQGCADDALYEVKEHGRNGYRLYEPPA